MKGKYIPPFEALEKMRRYCSVQERSYKAVREKLYGIGLHKDQVENIIADLISENYLNEQRFADAFASGRFRIKGWGKRKIELGLKQLGVSEHCINSAISSLDSKEYVEKLKALVIKAKKKERTGSLFERRGKVANYIIGRGFDPEEVWKHVKENIDQ